MKTFDLFFKNIELIENLKNFNFKDHFINFMKVIFVNRELSFHLIKFSFLFFIEFLLLIAKNLI